MGGKRPRWPSLRTCSTACSTSDARGMSASRDPGHRRGSARPLRRSMQQGDQAWIARVGEVVAALGCGEAAEAVGDGGPERLDGARRLGADEGLELGEGQLDRVQKLWGGGEDGAPSPRE